MIILGILALDALMAGMDYLSDITQWRAFCSVEDNIIGGNVHMIPSITSIIWLICRTHRSL